MQDQPSAIIYCRVSSQDQVAGTSLETQERLCREYCQRSGYTVREVFFERGESAKTANRTELKRAITFCTKSKPKVSRFVVYKLDRFSRNAEDHVTVRALLRRGGTELVSATEPIDGSPTGRLMEAMLAGIAEFDNSVRTERTKTGMLERVRQGIWVWPAPIGYYRPHRGSNLVPHPVEAELVRTVFEYYGAGVHTYRAVAEHVAAKGMRIRNGRPLSYQTVEKILHNPVYTGVIEVWGQRWAGTFPALVSQSLFTRCQPPPEKMRPHAAPRSLNNPLFPLRRLVVCSVCGEGLTGSSCTGRQGTRYPYYHHRSQRCPAAAYHSKEALEAAFVNELKVLAPREGAAEALCMVVRNLAREDDLTSTSMKRQLRGQLADLAQQRERVFELHRTGAYSDDDFREQKRLIELRQHEKSRLLAETAIGTGELDAVLGRLRERFDDVPRTWVELEPKYSERLELQQLIFSEPLPFDGKRFGTAQTTCIYSAMRSFDGNISSLVARCRAEWNQVVKELRGWR